MAGAHQHTAVYRLQRKYVPWLHQVIGTCVFCYGSLHGTGAVGGRNAGCHALGRFNRHRERGPHFCTVAHGHRWQLQPFAMGAGECQANQATPKARHEVDGLGTHMISGQDQVAFVLAVLFIHQNHHASGAHVRNDICDG